jgi:hypothetical protein
MALEMSFFGLCPWPGPGVFSVLLIHSGIGRKTLALRRRLDYAQRVVKTAEY